ncbi:MAG: MBL fold metallo-hydrolase [Candidatus Binatia bacterium]
MTSKITEVAPDVYRISTFVPDYGIQFNQFLVKDDAPFLMHTALKKMFPVTREAVASIIDPSRLRWIGFSHFESDECGALNEWLEIASQAQAVCSFVGAFVNVNDFALRPARALADSEVFEIGRHRLQFLATPHVPHCWDAGLFFEQTERTLLCSDLFFHPGDPEPVTESDIIGLARAAMLEGSSGPLANDMPYTPYTDRTLQRLADLKPRALGLMHGSTFLGDGEKALRDLAVVVKEILGSGEMSVKKT